MLADVILTFSVQIAIMLCMFATNKILSNKLDVDNFGLYNVARKSIAIISLVMQAGTGIALPRYLALYLGKGETFRAKAFLEAAILLILLVSGVICILGLCFKDILLEIVTGNSDIRFYFIAFGYAFTMALLALLYAYFRGLSDFKNYNLSQLITQIAMIVPLLIFKELSIGKVFASWAIIAIAAVLFYIISEKTQKRFSSAPTTFTDLKKEMKAISIYSLPRLVGDFFLFAFSAFPLIYLKENISLPSTAYYSVGITIVTTATPIFSILGTILLPYVSDAVAKNELQKVHKFINKLAILYIVIAILITGMFYWLMEYMIRILFSEDYLAAKEISQILIMSLLPQSLYLLYRNPIDAVSVFPYNTVLFGLSLLCIVVLFCLCQNLNQFAWSYVIVSILQGVFSFCVWNHLKKKKYYRLQKKQIS